MLHCDIFTTVWHAPLGVAAYMYTQNARNEYF